MPLRTSLSVLEDASALADATSILIIGRAPSSARPRCALAHGPGHRDPSTPCSTPAEPGDWGASTRAWAARARRVTLGVLPEPCARTNSPSRAWAIPRPRPA
ncbi:MAG: hypothetical protein H6740_11335 [Alphaproteobacteria bacterium]|nr:hypothetical protein [Alphaproteobacteria bacterium]